MATLDDFLSFLQGASNSAASVVSAPVDGINWALGKVGVPVSNKPVGGSEWLREAGFTVEPKNKNAGLLGEAIGGVLPIVAQAKAPQIAAGINKMVANAQAPAVLRKESGMFIGPGAKTWDAEAAKKAQTLAAKGVDPRQIWEETGTFKGPDGMWRQEIDDSASYIKGQDQTVLGALKYGNTPDKVMSHPRLEKAYAMDDVRIGSPEGMTARGSMSLVEIKPSIDDMLSVDDLMAVQPKRISEINVSRTAPDQRSTLLHELQHDIQRREGFATGGSMTEANVLDMLPEAKAMHQKLMLSRDPNEIGLLSKQLRALRNDPEKKLEAYRRLAGEAEARATQARMNLNAQQRRELFPLDSYDVPVDQLIVRRGLLDGPAMAIDPKGQKRLVDGLLGNAGPERYRLGDITRKQADEVYTFGGQPVGDSLNVYVTPSIGQEHAKVARVIEDGFVPPEVGVYAKQAMRPDSKVIPPATKKDYPLLRSESMLDPVTRKRYNAEMPLKPVEDGFELISVIPQGLPARKKPR